MSTNQPTNRLPWISVPSNGQAISVEHPCIIRNVEKGIDMIGGSPGISHVLEDTSKALCLTFSPQDPAAKTILSNNKPANNVLLRISVPARTNRKRKRGSTDPFLEDPTSTALRRDGAYLLRSMTDNANAYNVDAITTIQNMHIWRSMPDFVYSTSQIKVIQDVKEKLLTQHYPSIREFELPRSYGLENTEAIPPPVWSTQSIPQTYMYRQNPAVKVTNDPSTGKRVLRNIQAAPKIYSYQVQWDTPEYPKVPMHDIPPLEQQSSIFQRIVGQLRPLFEQRPLWTRRALLNQLNPAITSFNLVRFCIAYVAFAIRSGPWRDTYCCLGVDPRLDPKYRFYQTIMLQLVPKSHVTTITTGSAQAKANQNPSVNGDGSATPDLNTTEAQNETVRTTSAPTRAERERILETRQAFHRTWALNQDPTSHIFDGVSPLSPDGKVWQLCDITDAQIGALRDVHELHIRAICDVRYFGWYENGTSAKIRVALKAKVDALVEGKQLDSSLLEEFLKLPESIQFETNPNHAASVDESPNEAGNVVPTPSEERPEHVSQTLEKSKPIRTSSIIKMKFGTGSKDWFGDHPTRQQLEWASLYRTFARTEAGKAPTCGGAGKGRLSKSKLRFRRSYREPHKQKTPQNSQDQAATASASDQFTQNQETTNARYHGAVPSNPVHIDGEVHGPDDDEEFEEFEDGPELADGEEVLPSIEEFGFGGDEDEDELDLDVDIKMEEDEFGDAVEERAGETGIGSGRGSTQVIDPHLLNATVVLDEPDDNA